MGFRATDMPTREMGGRLFLDWQLLRLWQERWVFGHLFNSRAGLWAPGT